MFKQMQAKYEEGLLVQEESKRWEAPTGWDGLEAKVHGGSRQGMRAHSWNLGLLSYNIFFHLVLFSLPNAITLLAKLRLC